MTRCYYCGREIKDGQRAVVVLALGVPFHRPCARLHREERMAKGKAAESDKYGTISATKKEFHEGEPVFLIRGTDPFATSAIIEYARRCEREGATRELVDEAFDHAMRLAEWQRMNPELVKALPD